MSPPVPGSVLSSARRCSQGMGAPPAPGDVEDGDRATGDILLGWGASPTATAFGGQPEEGAAHAGGEGRCGAG